MADDRMIEKIQKLMALAERAGSQAEAEAAFARAQALMSKHAIDEAVLALKNTGHDVQIVNETIKIGTDRSCQNLFSTVARNNNCTTVLLSSMRLQATGRKAGRYRQYTDTIQIFGTHSDIEFTKMLYGSLLMFCERSLSIAREIDPRTYGGKAYGYSFRLGFAAGVNTKMRAARKVAMSEAEESAPGTELVLVSRAERAEAAVNAMYPTMGKARDISASRDDAYGSGFARGKQADVSGGRNNIGSRRAISG